MEAINGITFRDFACAGANIAGGMSVEKVCEILGVEMPVWEATQEAWVNKMAEISPEDMTFYGEVFTNPKQGKFANVEGGVTGPEEVLKKYPEWSDALKMEAYMSEASNVGIQPDIEKEFGITITEYTQLGRHWSKYFKENVTDVLQQQPRTSEQVINDEWNEDQKEAGRIFKLHGELTDKWTAYYKEKFKDLNANLSDDIDF